MWEINYDYSMSLQCEESVTKDVRPTTIAKSEIREFGFFRNHECRKTLSTTIGNPLIREVGYAILVGSGSQVHDPRRNLERETGFYGVQRLFCFF